jgi:beta-lactamase class A
MTVAPRLRFFWLIAIATFVATAIATTPLARAFPKHPPRATTSPARDQILQIIQQLHADVSVAFRSLDDTQELFIRADEPFPAAPAVIQLPVMMELYAQAGAGEVNLSDTVVVHNGFHSLIDDSPFDLDPKNDPDRELYRQIGKSISLRDLCERMMAHNSSLAADLLIEKLGAERIRQRIQALHVNGMDFVRGVEPEQTPAKGPNNSTTARAALELLWTLAKQQDSGDEDAKEMVGMIARAAYSYAPAAGMPSDPRKAQSLQLSKIGQEAIIVYGPHPFVVVTLARGISDAQVSAALMAQIEHALQAGLEAGLGGD